MGPTIVARAAPRQHIRRMTPSRFVAARARTAAVAARLAALRVASLAALLALAAAPADAQAPDTASYACRVERIAMRDGAKLNSRLCVPKDQSAPLPIVMQRTPYGVDGAYPEKLFGELGIERYLFVFQDIRGRYRSEGLFVMNRPLHDPGDSNGVDESTDTYDTVAWLIANVPRNNGRVGVLGVSYPGWLAAMAGINPHPAVKAVSPQAPMTDTWLGDDFFHQGAFRLSYGFEYAADMELSNNSSVPLPIGAFDTYDWYLALGPLSRVEPEFFKGRVPTWTAFTRHPAYDAYWKARALQKYLTAVTVPTLVVGGWWDQEDRFGPLMTYATLEARDTLRRNWIVMGPWSHGGWAGPGRRLGQVDFGSEAGDWFRANVQAPWFAFWLKDKGSLSLAEATMFEGGANRWRRFESWPPKANATPRSLYLHDDGRLTFEPPAVHELAGDTWVSDPAHPVPYRARPIEQTYDSRGSRWRHWEAEDQRFVTNRPDVMSWVTAPLTEDLSIAGNVVAKLVASTTGRDADWVVKLIDVYPDSVPTDWRMSGYQLMVAHDIMRGRYRDSFSAPAPITPNTPTPFTVDLHQQSYQFRRGHKIMVQVQSTWFPLYDRNPQSWVPNIFEAKVSDFTKQTHTIWHTVARPSRVEVTVVPAQP